MIKAQDIYAASNDGLDIILYYYPQAEGCVTEPKKKFKRRLDEDDASACLKKYGDCYITHSVHLKRSTKKTLLKYGSQRAVMKRR